jgi:AcrR family transcriptional regulator
MIPELPLATDGSAEPAGQRSDVVRNRHRVLAAATALIAERGVAAVTIDDVAAAAGVGRMTIYRRFGDKSGLARTLLGEAESALQQQILRGPPPLGPGAAPSERLAAFVEAYLRFCDAHLDLVRLAENADLAVRYRRGVYRLWHTHVRLLLEAAGAPNPDLRADLLLAGLVGDLLAHRRHERRDTLDDIITAVRSAAGALARP